MKLTAKVQLLTTSEQHRALLATLERANEACNYVSEVAWGTQTWRQFSLHKLVYYDVRERFGLTAQMAIRVESKVADSYKLDKRTKRTFRPHGAIAYDSRILKWKLSSFSVSIWTLEGRQEMLYSTGVRQLEWLKFQQGESDLVYSGGKFYLLATCEVPEPTPEDVDGYLGVDLGITEIATDSLQTSYSGAQVKRVHHTAVCGKVCRSAVAVRRNASSRNSPVVKPGSGGTRITSSARPLSKPPNATGSVSASKN